MSGPAKHPDPGFGVAGSEPPLSYQLAPTDKGKAPVGSNIVAKLRTRAGYADSEGRHVDAKWMRRAGTEIERLRAELAALRPSGLDR